jgi:hypothetical protein
MRQTVAEFVRSVPTREVRFDGPETRRVLLRSSGDRTYLQSAGGFVDELGDS